MQNISGTVNLISNVKEKNFLSSEISKFGAAASSVSSISFKDHLDHAVRPSREMDRNETADEYSTKKQLVEEKDQAENSKSGDEILDHSEAGETSLSREAGNAEKDSKNSEENGSLNNSDKNKDLNAESARRADGKQSEKKLKGSSDISQTAPLQAKKDLIAEGLLNEFMDKISRSKTGDRQNHELLKNKMKSPGEHEKKTAAEDKTDRARETESSRKNLETVSVMLDPEKWKVSGRVEEKEASLSGNHDKKNILPVKEKMESSTDGKGDGQKDQKSGGFNEFKNIFADNRDVRSSQISGSSNSPEMNRADSKNMFNELVEKARLNLGSDGNSTASIRMNPESLGRLTMNLRMMDGVLEAKILVGSEAAKKMIMDDIETLKFELRSQGIQVDSFTVRVKESVFSGMDHDTDHSSSFFQNDANDSGSFAGNSDSEENNNIFTNNILENLDDIEYGDIDYGTISFEQGSYEGTVNLSV